MEYISDSLVVREAPFHAQQTNIVSDTSESPEKRPSLQQDKIMPDKMTKLKKPKKPRDIRETERDEFKARGEDKEERKKKRHSQQSPPSAPPWIWWLAGGPNQRKKRPSHKSTKEKSSSSKKHSTKERSTDKKKKTTSTTKRTKRRERKDESEDDMEDETNSAAGDLGVDDGENDYGMMPSQAKQSYKNHTWIDEHHSSVGSNRTDYPMPAHDRTPFWPSNNTGYTDTNRERELATRDQRVCPQGSPRQNNFQPPAVQHDYRSTSQNDSQTRSTSVAHQQPRVPQNNFTSTSQENNTGHVDKDHGALPTIQEEPPRSTSRQSNTERPKQEQNTATAGRDTATSSGDGCGVTNKGGDEQESKEAASQQAGENEPKIPESTDTTSKKADDPQVKEQLKEQAIGSNGPQGNPQESRESDESQVNENESTESDQLSSCTVT